MKTFTRNDGSVVNLYNPKEKADYYRQQLITGLDGNGTPLTPRQKSHRAGYVTAYDTGAIAYNAVQAKKGK